MVHLHGGRGAQAGAVQGERGLCPRTREDSGACGEREDQGGQEQSAADLPGVTARTGGRQLEDRFAAGRGGRVGGGHGADAVCHPGSAYPEHGGGGRRGIRSAGPPGTVGVRWQQAIATPRKAGPDHRGAAHQASHRKRETDTAGGRRVTGVPVMVPPAGLQGLDEDLRVAPVVVERLLLCG